MRKSIMFAIVLLSLIVGQVALASESLFVMIPHAESEKEYEWFMQGVNRFKASNPGVEVQVHAISGMTGGNLPQKLTAYLAAGEIPDMVMMMQRDLGAMIDAGSIQDLNVYLDREPSLKTREFVGAFLKYWSRDGKQLAMPINPDVGYIHYDTDLFAEAGLPPLNQSWPKGDWTWADFRRIAQRLVKDTDGDGTPEVYAYSASISWDPVWCAWLYSNGGDIFDLTTGKSQLTQPRSLEAFQFLWKLRRDNLMAPFSPNAQRRGLAAMETLAAGWAQYHAAVGAQVSSFVHPGASATQPAVHNILGPGLLMFKESKNKDLAWKLMVELMSNESMASLATLTGRLPSRLSAFSTWAKSYETKMSNSEYVLQAVQNSRGLPYNAKWSEMAPVIRSGVSQIWTGKQSALAAMESVSARIEAIFK